MARRRKVLTAALVVTATLAGLVFWPQAGVKDAGFLRDAAVPDPVRKILERSCADCHSSATRYPWYSFVPVVSRIVENDIARGREQLNFSVWSGYSRLRRQRALTGIANQVKDGAMPLPNYLLLHPLARLSRDEVEAVFQWAQQERLRLILQGTANQP